MPQSLDREDVLALLRRLGEDDDADVLSAARTLHAQIGDAGVDWDELLAAEPFTDEAESSGAPETGGKAVTGKGGRDADTLTLIDQLMAMPNRSEALREELEEYKSDIANGDFQARDHQYVRALHKRLLG